jgi:hypothetical protein
MEFEKVCSRKPGFSIVIDFQAMNIHTGTYVKESWERAIESSGETTMRGMVARAWRRNSISAKKRKMDFRVVERALDLS